MNTEHVLDFLHILKPPFVGNIYEVRETEQKKKSSFYGK